MDDDARELCLHIRSRLVGTLFLICGEMAIAEELAQEALARTWSRWRTVRRLDSADAWVYRVGINLANSWVRRRGAERRAVARLAVRTEDEPHDAAEALAVRRAVAGLPKRQRMALVLRYYADLPITQVAELMRCRPGTVKSLTSQAVAALREEFLSEAVSDES